MRHGQQREQHGRRQRADSILLSLICVFIRESSSLSYPRMVNNILSTVRRRARCAPPEPSGQASRWPFPQGEVLEAVQVIQDTEGRGRQHRLHVEQDLIALLQFNERGVIIIGGDLQDVVHQA